MSQYVDVMLRKPEIAHELHARLVTAVHSRIAQGDTLHVAWPDWRDTPGEFGLLVRVFGDTSALERYRSAIAPFVDRGLLLEFPINDVPDTSRNMIVFQRDRRADRDSPARERRRQRRAAARGEAAELPEGTREQLNRPHYLMIQSATTGQTFPLYVRKDRRANARASGNQYGLGVPVPNF